MLLTVKQRLLIGNVLPEEADFITLKVVKELQDVLSFSEEETNRLEIRREGDMYLWKEGEGDIPVEIHVGDAAKAVITGTLRGLSANGQLRMEFLPLYEHFVEGEEWPSKDGKLHAV